MRNNTLKFRGRFTGYTVFFVVFALVFLLFLNVNCSTVSADASLANKYAPILYFENEETCYPVDASYHIDNSYLYEIGGTGTISTNPTASLLSTYSGDEHQYHYLDNQKGTVNDDGVINDYKGAGYAQTVYYKVHLKGGTTVVQYWMFYAFNKGELNQHEGDWEMVQVVIPSSGSKWVAYSQHHSGQWATWDQVEKDGDHIKVYVARGAHANYLRSFSGKLGIASDIVGDNGKILKSGDYTLVDLDDQSWLDFAGLWGEAGEGGVEEAVSSSVLGRAGPPGPKYREEGKMWDDPGGWGKSLPQANDQMFLAEWFLYNFVTIFIVLTVISLAIMGFFIYRRHKKYGLGPRIVSILYIDGLNLKSIGNILCIVGIIIAIFGLVNTWYDVSYEFSGTGVQSLETEGWQSLMKIDGLEGIQLTVPGESGPTPVGTLLLPFSLLLGIGLVFLIIASIGIVQSKKLGTKYIWRGIRLFLPIISILIVIMALGSLIPSDMAGEDLQGAEVNDIFSSISSSPIGNQESFDFTYTESDVTETATLNMKWGLGLGGWLLLFAAIILMISGVLEILAKTQFFQPKTPVGKPPKEKRKKSKKKSKTKPGDAQQPIPPPPTAPAPPQDASKASFCPECGTKLEEGATFCPECGTKL